MKKYKRNLVDRATEIGSPIFIAVMFLLAMKILSLAVRYLE